MNGRPRLRDVLVQRLGAGLQLRKRPELAPAANVALEQLGVFALVERLGTVAAVFASADAVAHGAAFAGDALDAHADAPLLRCDSKAAAIRCSCIRN